MVLICSASDDWMNKMEIIDFRNDLTYRLFHYLKNYGIEKTNDKTPFFKMARCTGLRMKHYEASQSLGLISRIQRLPQRGGWFWRFFFRTRRVFIGVIWLTRGGERNYSVDATKKNWRFEVFGEKNLSIVKRLIADLKKEFNVEINVSLCQEELKGETYDSDYGL